MNTKVCRDCRLEKPLTAFYTTESGAYRPDCKRCRNGKRNQWSRNRNNDMPPPQPKVHPVIEKFLTSRAA